MAENRYDRFDFAARTRQDAFEGRRTAEDRDDVRGYEEFRRSREERMRADFDRWRGRSSASGLDVFDRSLQTTHIWLNEIVDEIGPDKQIAWHVLTAVLRTIRDRIQPELAVHLGAQLPMLVRGAYFDQFRLGWPERSRNLEDFLDSLVDHMRGIGRPVNPRDALHAVARTLTRHISEGQIRKVVDSLPEAVRRSWIDACRDILGPEARSGRRI